MKDHSPQEIISLVNVLGATVLDPTQMEIVYELRIGQSQLLRPELFLDG